MADPSQDPSGTDPMANQPATTAATTPPVTGTLMIPISNPNNAASPEGYGACASAFSAGAYKWTVDDWTKNVLNIYASTVDPVTRKLDAHGLWYDAMKKYIDRKSNGAGGWTFTAKHGMGKRPMTFLNYFDCCRGCNIMHNLAAGITRSADETFDKITEDGAYKMVLNTDGSQNAIRRPGALYFIFSHDQWVKAAYYGLLPNGMPHYYNYPTTHDEEPGDRDYARDLENKANWDYHSWFFATQRWARYVTAPPAELCDVDYCGHYVYNDDQTQLIAQGTRSYYGCIDMGGNANEWTSTCDDQGNYFVRGGSYKSTFGIGWENNELCRAYAPTSCPPTTRLETIGFRMAGVEELANLGNGSPLVVDSSSIFNPLDWSMTTDELVVVTVATAGTATATYYLGYWTFTGVGAGLYDGGQWVFKKVTQCLGYGEEGVEEGGTRWRLPSNTSVDELPN